jgi:sugar O-acyltransferase (sialic acid O-acetyltransferase NeuD family)
MKDLVLWGGKGHALVLAELSAMIGYRIVALFENNAELKPLITGIPLYRGEEGFRDWLKMANCKDTCCQVAVGGNRGAERIALLDFMHGYKLKPITLIHPRSFVCKSVEMGEGCQLLANSCVAAGARLGICVIVNHGAIVDHECVLGNGVHIAPGAVLSGEIMVGRHAFIGAGAVVLPRVNIGKDAIIGAGAVVVSDVPDGVTVVGNPARILREVNQVKKLSIEES